MIKEAITILANKENSEYCNEFRKWRVIFVMKNLPDNNSNDFISNLLVLGDIWAKLSFPEDSPHIIQGKGNDISPEQYYTIENYNKLLKRHNEWVVDEINKIIDIQK